jgi:hypothetical protein
MEFLIALVEICVLCLHSLQAFCFETCVWPLVSTNSLSASFQRSFLGSRQNLHSSSFQCTQNLFWKVNNKKIFDLVKILGACHS